MLEEVLARMIEKHKVEEAVVKEIIEACEKNFIDDDVLKRKKQISKIIEKASDIKYSND
tara:strand:+ start:486 stop:662 length:177 start_codon:yes stop_codon:yes gene_type:complete